MVGPKPNGFGVMAFSRAYLPALCHHWAFGLLLGPEKQGRPSCELPGESPAIGFPYVVSLLGPLMVFMDKYPIFRLKHFLLLIIVLLAGLHSRVSF